MKDKQPIKLTREQATNRLTNLLTLLANHPAKIQFTLTTNTQRKFYRITCVKDADNVKVLFPQFTLETNERQQRYAQYEINYE